MTRAASGYLDAIRALAVSAVMLSHLRGFFFVDYRNIEAGRASPAVAAIYAFTGFGHQAVMIFFVLSGFFVSSSVLRNLQTPSWSWREYAIDRAVRLYVVLIPGLLLGLAWDVVGTTFFNRSVIYSAPLVPFGDAVPIKALGLSAFIGNLLFLQSRFTPVFGSNGPLWSLFNEFWYYVLFPVLIAVIVSARRHAIGPMLGSLLLASLTAWILGSQLVGFVVWLAGVGVALTANSFGVVSSSRLLAAIYSLCAGVVALVCLFAARTGNRWLGSDLAVGLSFALLMHGFLQLQVPIGTFVSKMAKTFGGFSYSLYVLHFPLLFFVRAKCMPTSQWQPDAVHLAYGLCIAACVLLYAFIVAWNTEWKTPAVRQWIRERLANDIAAVIV